MKNKAWLYVILTCIFEIFWVFGFNTANTWWHWIIILGVIAVDFHFLSKACEHLATGTVYAVFAGAGTVGTFLMDVFLSAEFQCRKIILYRDGCSWRYRFKAS